MMDKYLIDYANLKAGWPIRSMTLYKSQMKKMDMSEQKRRELAQYKRGYRLARKLTKGM